jgi:hypothetical protein
MTIEWTTTVAWASIPRRAALLDVRREALEQADVERRAALCRAAGLAAQELRDPRGVRHAAAAAPCSRIQSAMPGSVTVAAERPATRPT